MTNETNGEVGENWYSGTLRFFFLSSAKGRIAYEDCVYLVHATSFKAAFNKFLAAGRRYETSFTNEYGHEVRIRLAAILTWDRIDDDLDGAQITSQIIDDDDPRITFDTPLHPENSRPEHTGV